MREAKRKEQMESLERMGPYVFGLRGSAKTYIQGFLAGIETAERGKEETKDERSDQPSDNK